MLPKSVSLTVQLLVTLVGLVVVATGVLTVDAYRTSRQHLEAEARDVARVTAQQREQTVARLIELRYQQAQGFLTSVASLCGETTPRGATAFEIECVGRALQGFRAAERASGARMEYGRQVLAEVGRSPSDDPAVGAPYARILPRDNSFDYGIRATDGRATLIVEFPLASIDVFFTDRSGLGERGDIFMLDARGEFLTAPHGGSISIPRGAARVEPIQECLSGATEAVDLDYRGVQTIHGLRASSLFVDPVCIDAHVSYDEALAPADTLRNQLIMRGALFALIGLLLSVVIAHWITTPVRRLARAAAALEAGDFDRPVPVAGPSEVRALGRRLAAMARSLSELVTREQNARLEAEAANRTKDDFLATVSHELRTPLTAILGWANLLRLGRLDARTTRRAVDAIERSANAQARLVEDLLDVTRIVAGRLQLNCRTVSIIDPVQAALEANRPQAVIKGVRLQTEIETTDARVFGDPQRLQQVVSNLLTNAIKFTPADGIVTLRVHRQNDHAVVTVTDSGVGMSPEFLPHAFDQFRQAEQGSSGGQSGLGLGLAIVRRLVMLHGGQVEASSGGIGLGATFTVTLPATDEGVEHEMHVGSHIDSHESARLDSARVLFVDDDAETRQMVRELLEQAGATVQTAASVDEARSVMAWWTPTVLISDIAMPRETGYEFVKSLRASHVTVPAIALTAYARRGDAEEALAAGFQLYMAKPVQPVELVESVARLADGTEKA
jgi:signal transduction histidine kinase/ActR/RegA family two-component response regulator